VKKPLPPNLMIPPSQTIFAKIAAGKVAADRVYEDEHVCAFKDIDPQAPSHILIIAKKLAIGQVCCLFVILSKIFFLFLSSFLYLIFPYPFFFSNTF